MLHFGFLLGCPVNASYAPGGGFSGDLNVFHGFPYDNSAIFYPQMTNGNRREDEKQFGQNGGLLPIITGNWGCGSSGGGDAQLKSMLQWMAASRSGAPCLVYYTAGASSVVKVK